MAYELPTLVGGEGGEGGGGDCESGTGYGWRVAGVAGDEVTRNG